jgi:hypothetical protein
MRSGKSVPSVCVDLVAVSANVVANVPAAT